MGHYASTALIQCERIQLRQSETQGRPNAMAVLQRTVEKYQNWINNCTRILHTASCPCISMTYLDQNWRKLGSKLDQTWIKVGAKLDHLDQTWIEIGSELDQKSGAC